VVFEKQMASKFFKPSAVIRSVLSVQTTSKAPSSGSCLDSSASFLTMGIEYSQAE